MLTFDTFVLYFVTYAFLGWVWEFVFIYATSHRFHWHGFLRLPILPIYGFSAIGMILFVRPYTDNPWLVFVGSFLLVTALEFCTGLVLDKVFHMRLWDYKGWPLNVNGYVSIISSLAFGVMGLVLLYFVQPWVARHIQSLGDGAITVLGTILTIAIAVDFANSLGTIIRVRIEKARGAGTFVGLQERVRDASTELARTHEGVQRVLMTWYRSNVDHLVRAFPSARLTDVPQGSKE